MSTIKFFRAMNLPDTVTPEEHGIWFVRSEGKGMEIWMAWNGELVKLDAVTNKAFNAVLEDYAKDDTVVKLRGDQEIDGSKSFKKAVVLQTAGSAANHAVRKDQMDAALNNKADDHTVVKLSGNQTVSGIKTFTVPPRFEADAISGTEGVRKSQLDNLLAIINQSISDLESAVVDNMAPPVDLDCSGNPNYPASAVGDRYIVSADGKIGGPNGEQVTVGDLIVCKVATAGGDQATAGSKFYILQTNIHDASTTVKGYIQLATQAEVNAGSDTKKAVTPATLSARLDALQQALETGIATTSDGKYVRYDAVQGLTTAQKNQARTNMGAAADSDVVKTSGNQTIAGVKTFSSPVKIPAAAAGGDAVQKSQMDSALAAKANDNAVVKLSGAQTVDGKKTFNVVPASLQDAVGDNDLMRKSQVDAMLSWWVDDWA